MSDAVRDDNDPVQRNTAKPHPSTTKNRMDFSRIAWFTSGLVVGSILDRSTTLILILAWMLVSNEPLPAMLGGYQPQQIASYIFRSIEYRLKKQTKNDNVEDTADNIDTVIEEIDTSSSSGLQMVGSNMSDSSQGNLNALLMAIPFPNMQFMPDQRGSANPRGNRTNPSNY